MSDKTTRYDPPLERPGGTVWLSGRNRTADTTRLAEAAPDLLEALESCVEVLGSQAWTSLAVDEVIGRARAAIRKATR
jgi:hypothetical protein